MEERRSSVANGQERKKEIFFFVFLFFFFSAFLLSGVIRYLRSYYSCPRSSKLKLTFRSGTFVSVLLTYRKQQLVYGGSLARDLTHTHNSGGKIPR